MYYELKPQVRKLEKLLKKIPNTPAGKTNLAVRIVDDFVRPAGQSDTGRFYSAAGVLVSKYCSAEAKRVNVNAFAEEYDLLMSYADDKID